MISNFPQFKSIELIDREPLEDYFKNNPILISEFTFTNIFIWRNIYNYKVSRYNEGFLVFADYKDRPFFLPPLVGENLSGAVNLCLDYLKDKTKTPSILRTGEDFISQDDLNDKFDIQEDRDNFDYVYSTSELIELKREKFHDKKNLLNQFSKKNSYKYLPLATDRIEDCLNFMDEWCDDRNCPTIEGLANENLAIKELLLNFDSLSATGGIIELDGNVAAFTSGEPLNNDTFVIHIEKAIGNIVGLYQVINLEFLKNQAHEFKFVNREQDLGASGLRKAKMSYNPIRFVKKYRIYPKQ